MAGQLRARLAEGRAVVILAAGIGGRRVAITNAEPERPAKMIAVMRGPSSRVTESPTRSARRPLAGADATRAQDRRD